ncbi:MAG: hypothetical protein KA604_04365 [Candidatus Saccharimonas sp.]|nr:hypothetical protein [Candidatus Saccharimonas sp.]
MTRFLEAHFDAATSGSITTALEPGISSTTGTAPTFSAADTIHGAAGALSASGVVSILRQDIPSPLPSIYWRGYIKRVLANPTVAQFAAARDSANANCASLAMQASGAIVLRDGNTAVATSTHTLAAGDWVRVEWYVDRGGTSTQTLELFYSGNIEGTIPNEVLTGACTAATTPLHQVSSGSITASAGAQFAVDEAVLADAYVGPFASPPYTVTVWNGTTEDAVSSVTVWDGSTEVVSNIFGVTP